MAQLPPRVPNWTPTFPNWADDFLDFTSARRGAHRRSLTDSIAFLEPPFDKLDDDDQLISMFSDDIPTAASNSSSTSDQNRGNEDKQDSADLSKAEQGEAQSYCNPNSAPDPKRVKSNGFRIIANRQSAQRSRVRKLQYISDLERSVTSLQSEVSALSPRVAFLDHQRLILNVDNGALKQRIAALAQDNIFKDAHQEALKKEIERLRKIYNQQSKSNEQPPSPATSEQLITS